VLYRKKSAYPNVRNPVYNEATRNWALLILNDSNAPIQQILNSSMVRAELEGQGNGSSGIAQVSLFERIILINEWFEKYHITLSL
jgi:hypothetical protein